MAEKRDGPERETSAEQEEMDQGQAVEFSASANVRSSTPDDVRLDVEPPAEPQSGDVGEPRPMSATTTSTSSTTLPNGETPAEPGAEETPSDTGMEPDRGEPSPAWEPLFEVEEIEVRVSLLGDDAQAWHLAANGLAIPLGVDVGMQGGLAQGLKGPLGNRWDEFREALRRAARPAWKRLRDRQREERLQDPDHRPEPLPPVHVPLDDELGRVLLPNAPEPPAAARWQPDVEVRRYQAIAVTVGNLEEVQQVGQVAAAVVKEAARHGVWRLALPTLGTGRGPFKDQGPAVGEQMVRSVYDALHGLEEGAIGEITLATRDPETRRAMIEEARRLTMVPQRLVSDEPRGPDLLDVKVEAGSLAEALLLDGVEPPLAVGILGGWGSGKSFVMELMRRRMQQIRGYRSPGWNSGTGEGPQRTYVGHVYLIEFNAWTYAKSNLWASLMQTIFEGLNRQLSLEKQLVDALVAVELREREWTEKQIQGEEEWPEDQRKEKETLRDRLTRTAWLGANDLWPALYAAGDAGRRLLLETELGGKVLAELQGRGIDPNALWAYLQKRTRTEMAELEDLRDELEQDRRELAAKVVWAPTRAKLMALLSKQAWESLRRQLDKEDAETLEKVVGQLTPDSWSVVRSAIQQPDVLALALFAVVVLAVPAMLDLVQWPSRLIAALTALAGSGRAFLHWQGTLNEIREEFRVSVEDERARLEAGETKYLDTDETRVLSKRVAKREAEVRQREERVGLTARYRSLHEFIRDRLDEGYYEKMLGLMHRVECDLKELTEALYIRQDEPPDSAKLKRGLFPRGQPRIVLFIDDVDRCPPDRVVEVLEAVQLLLKTELFVVVLGLDTRYVTRALEKAYEGILIAEGEPSGLDYIEKILTLPYRVRPIQREAVPGFLKGQKLEILVELAPAEVDTGEAREEPEVKPAETDVPEAERDKRPPPAERVSREEKPPPMAPAVVAFAPAEYEAMESVCQAVQLTPRSLKRITNVMKLIKIYWHRDREPDRPPEPPSPQRVQVVAALLALSARYPEVMRDAFAELGLRYREPEAYPRGLEEPWHEFFEGFARRHAARNQHLRARKDEFLADVKATLATEMILAIIDERSFNLARSCSFVGDPTPLAEPRMKVEVVDRMTDSDRRQRARRSLSRRGPAF